MIRKQLFFTFVFFLLFFIAGCVNRTREVQPNATEQLSPDSSANTFIGKIKNFFTGEKPSDVTVIAGQQKTQTRMIQNSGDSPLRWNIGG